MKTGLVVLLGVAAACGTTATAGSDASGANGSDSGAGGNDGSSGGGISDQYRSGTRIKMKVLTSPDGAKVFQGNYDSLRGEDCNFSLATNDGVIRCLPGIIAMAIDAPNAFSEETCTSPIAIVQTCDAETPKYISLLTSVSCPARFKWDVIYNASKLSITRYYTKNGTGCVGTVLSTGQSVYAASGPPIPPTSFQPGVIGIE